jgi:CheY-like chemotaxis protein
MNADLRTNEELLAAARGGDEGALASLFERHRDRLERVVRLRMDSRLQGRVDPADVFRRLNKRMIAAAGIGCHTAGTPAQAVRLVQANPDISVVVIDLDSPVEPVAELVTELRNARATLQILGASSGESGQDWTAAAGISLVLSKPWTVGSLVDLIGQN